MNNGYSYRSVIPRAGDLLELLSEQFRHSSLQVWQERLERGEIELAGKLVRESVPVRGGQELVWHRPPWYEEPVPRCTEILYEDDDLLAVNKPSGLPTMPAGGFLEHTLLWQLRERWSSLTPLHRLGRGTSGVVLCALSPRARAMAGEWQQRTEKHYLALSRGKAKEEHYSIRVPIGRVPHSLLGKVYSACESGKPSHSEARVLARSEEQTLFGVQIFTGRPHQIRIHLASIGYPLLGDPLYGLGATVSGALVSDLGYWLHAHRLGLVHPVSGKKLEIIATVPPFPTRCLLSESVV